MDVGDTHLFTFISTITLFYPYNALIYSCFSYSGLQWLSVTYVLLLIALYFILVWAQMSIVYTLIGVFLLLFKCCNSFTKGCVECLLIRIMLWLLSKLSVVHNVYKQFKMDKICHLWQWVDKQIDKLSDLLNLWICLFFVQSAFFFSLHRLSSMI